ncbi:hypothetical protein CDAR_308151 [Caerostris darwini]|uniref:Uncharacterized protein n=1 Tax=Caerostris darwini TaxID=1538125 RepID=A0AAV4UZI8_9ARAC|nr:hypothetical protein CDAR_308151 [Caerostris darwini]
MSGRGSPVPDTNMMDISTGNDEQPPYRLPPNPPVSSDEFLYINAQVITKVIELKATMLADWFRPKDLDPESAKKLDESYDATTAEMLALCEGLGIQHDKLPNDINELHNRIKPIHLRLHAATAPSREKHQKPPAKKGKGKRPLDTEGYQAPPKHLICKPAKEITTDSAPLPTGNPFALPDSAAPPSNDPAESTAEKTRKLRVPPFFVRPTPNWIVNIGQPFQSRKIADNISFADIISNRNQAPNVNNNNPAPPQVNNFNSAPPKGNNFNSAPILSDAALQLFKILSQFAHDDTLHFPSLLSAIRSALPTLELTQNDNEKAIIIFEHYHAHYNNSR